MAVNHSFAGGMVTGKQRRAGKAAPAWCPPLAAATEWWARHRIAGDAMGSAHPTSYLARDTAAIVLSGNVLAGVVGHQRGRDQGDNRANGDVDRDRIGRMSSAEQPGRDQRRRTASDDGGELVTERGAAVAQPPGETLGDQGGLRAV